MRHWIARQRSRIADWWETADFDELIEDICRPFDDVATFERSPEQAPQPDDTPDLSHPDDSPTA